MVREIHKPEYEGPLGDPNRVRVNDLKQTGQRAEAYAEVIITLDPSGIADPSYGWMKGDTTRTLTAIGASCAGRQCNHARS